MELIVLAVGMAVAVLVWILQLVRTRQMLDDWARDNGYVLVEVKRRFFATGPFFGRTKEGQEVFRIRASDKQDRCFSGYVRVSSFFLGLFCDTVTAEWDDEDATIPSDGPSRDPLK